MNWCCISRSEDDRHHKYKNLSDNSLKDELKIEKQNKNRNCWFGTLYATTATGTALATVLSGGASSVLGTVPTTVLASVATYDSFNYMYDSQKNINSIENILNTRKNAEIIFVDNKNAVTIYNENYIERQKINIFNENIKKKNITLELKSL